MAAHTLVSDDVVDGGGNTFNEIWTPNGSGTSGHPIILQNAIIEGATPSPYASGIDLTTRSWITIQNMTIQNQTGANSRAILANGSPSNIVIDTVAFNGGGVMNYGVLVNGVSVGNMTISNSTFKKITVRAISFNGCTNSSATMTLTNDTVGGSLVDASQIGLAITSCSGAVFHITNLNISYATATSNYAGIYLTGTTFGNGSYINNSSVTYSQNSSNLLIIGGGNLTVNNSAFNYAALSSAGQGVDIESNPGGATSNFTFNNIETAYNLGDGFSVAQGTQPLHDITCNNCKSHHNGTAGDPNAGDGYTAHGAAYNLYFNNSLAYDNDLTAFAMVNTTSGVINNGVSARNGVTSHTRAGIFLNNDGTNPTTGTGWTVKNTIGYNDMPYAVYLSAGAVGISTLTNNRYVLSGSATAFAKINGSDESWGTYSATYDQQSNVMDPLMQNPASNDFTLQSTSPAIDAGTSVGLTTDYSGNPIYGAPDIGAYEYQPPYTLTTTIPTTGSVRLYSNGKYRALTATSSASTATFSVTPVGGSFYTASTSAYMDITVNTWITANKEWIATSTMGQFNTHATSTVYTLGDLTPNAYYSFKLDGSPSPSTITNNSQCTAGVCLADGSGNLSFTYTGGYSTHTFDLVALPVATTQDASSLAQTTATVNGNITSTGGASVTIRGFAWGTSATLSGGDTATTTDSVDQPFSTGAYTSDVSSLTCNTPYYFRPYATNSAGTGLGSIQSFTTTSCPSGGSSSQNGRITIINTVVNDNGGTKAVSDFLLFVNGTNIGHQPVVSGVTNTFYTAGLYQYNVTETINPQYVLTFSGDCDFNGQIVLAPDNNKICTITNNDIASVSATSTASTTSTTTPTTTPSGLSSIQISSILAVLASFGADAATIANVQAALLGTTVTTSSTTVTSSSFTRDLQLGTTGADVKALQQYLNQNGFTVATQGSGSPGHETTLFGLLTRAALIRYQKANNITPAVGYFGPLTRAKVTGM